MADAAEKVEVARVVPTAAPIVTLPSGVIAESSVDKATREARERVAAGQPLVKSDAAAAPAAAVEPAKPAAAAGEPARNADGTFAKADGEAAPAAGQGDKEPEKVEGDEEEGDDKEVPADETEDEKRERESRDRTVTLLDRNGKDIDIEFPEGTPKEIVDSMRALRNSAMRTTEIQTASEDIQRRADELAQVRAEIELDPVGYLMGVATDNPVIELTDGTEINVVDHLVMNVLTQPKVWERLKDRVESMLTDEKELRVTRAEAREQRLAIRGEMGAIAEERAVISRNLQEVQATVGALIPTEMSEAQQPVLYRDCLRDLKEYAERNRLLTIPPKDIPAILAHRLTAYGINPVEAATRVTSLATRRAAAARRPAAPAAGPGGKPAAPAREREKVNGQRFVVSAKKKGEVAAIPPVGAGAPSPTSGIKPPRKADGSPMGIQETIDWHRKQVQSGLRRVAT